MYRQASTNIRINVGQQQKWWWWWWGEGGGYIRSKKIYYISRWIMAFLVEWHCFWKSWNFFFIFGPPSPRIWKLPSSVLVSISIGLRWSLILICPHTHGQVWNLINKNRDSLRINIMMNIAVQEYMLELDETMKLNHIDNDLSFWWNITIKWNLSILLR